MSKRIDPRTLLRFAALYKGFQALLGGRRARRLFIEHHVRPAPGQRILDMGCGPGDILGFLPAVDYYGFDVNPEYIDAAQRLYGDRGTFLCGDVETFAVPEPGTFDVVLALGVLYHLNDDEALRLFRQAAQVLKPSGHLLTLDGCFVPDQNALACLLLKTDRGRFVRAQPAYETLAHGVFTQIDATIEERFFHVPYTLLLMDCRHAMA